MNAETMPGGTSQVTPQVLPAHHLKHKRTRPYAPRTDGKAERFIQTSIREWAFGTPFQPLPSAPVPCIPGCTTTTPQGRTQP
jgi:hypothetical protein